MFITMSTLKAPRSYFKIKKDVKMNNYKITIAMFFSNI